MSPLAGQLVADARPRLPDPDAPTGVAPEGPTAAPAPSVERRFAASGVSVGRNLLSFAVALLFVVLVVLFACAIGLLIAGIFYGSGGLG